MCSLEVYINLLERKRRVRSNPLEPPLPTGLSLASLVSLYFRLKSSSSFASQLTLRSSLARPRTSIWNR